MTDQPTDAPLPPDDAALFFNKLIATVLRVIARDDHDLAALWAEQMMRAGGWYITPAVEGGWRDILVDGDRFASVALHPDPDTFLVKVTQGGMTQQMALRMVHTPDDGGQ